MSSIDLAKLIKENVRSLKPYAVENIQSEIKLHANESPFPPSKELHELFIISLKKFQLNRYPDPDSKNLKQSIAKKLATNTEQLVIGNGSDEIILLLLQVFCNEGDTIIIPDPTFAMYAIISQSLGVKTINVPLNSDWDINANQILETADKNSSRLIFLSYPNNPTGNCFSETEVRTVIEEFNGIVVMDEAYYDFSKKSFVREINKHNNIVVLRSFSKIGLAAMRVGFGVANTVIIQEINKVRLPYNSNMLSQSFAEHLINNFEQVQTQINYIIDERNRLIAELGNVESITVFPTDSNFILFQTKYPANELFYHLLYNGILVRNLSSHPKLNNCLRVTIGSKVENERFLSEVKSYVGDNA
jgi:histidinol-phosphate aminotransferase